jgi:hypothetical protein
LLLTVFAYGRPSFISHPRTIGLAYLLSVSLGLIFLMTWLGKNFRVKENCPGKPLLKDLFIYSWPLFLSSILWLALSGLDSLILGLFTRPQEVAYYNIAMRTAPLVALPLVAVNAVVPPLFAQFHHRRDLQGLEMMARSTARWIYFAALPLAITTILLAPTLLGFFGTDFTQARFALSILAVTGQCVGWLSVLYSPNDQSSVDHDYDATASRHHHGTLPDPGRRRLRPEWSGRGQCSGYCRSQPAHGSGGMAAPENQALCPEGGGRQSGWPIGGGPVFSDLALPGTYGGHGLFCSGLSGPDG